MKTRLLFCLIALLGVSGSLRAQQQNFPSGSGSGSTAAPAPKMAFYLTADCSTVVNAYCQNTFSDTQIVTDCNWTNASPNVTCLSQLNPAFAILTSNVATFGSAGPIVPSNWAIGQSITITGFPGFAFFDVTCNISALTTTTVSCPITHADSSPGAIGIVTNNSVGPFVAGDVGKSAMGANTCSSDQNNVGGFISTTLLPTIASFINSTQVSLSLTPANTGASPSCFIYGHLDDTAATAVDNLMIAAQSCPKLFLASSNYFFASPHFFTNPTACTLIGPGSALTAGAVGFGNTALPAGVEIEGRGVGNTAWYLTPTFPSGDACNHKPTLSAGGNGGCFAIPVMGKWSDFRIDGGAQSNPPNMPTSRALIYMTVGTLQNFLCNNYGAFGSSTDFGIEMGWQSFLYQVNNSGCMAVGFAHDGSTGTSNGFRVVGENNGTSELLMNGASSGVGGIGFTCYWCTFLGSANSNSSNVIDNRGGTIKLFGGSTTVALAAGNNNNALYKCQTTSGCVLYADGHAFTATGAGASNSAITCSVACTNFLSNTRIDATGAAYSDAASSKLFDGCNNSFNSGTVSVSGSVFGSCSITGTLQTSGNWSVPAGAGAGQWGTSPSVATCSGNALVQTCTITVGSGTVGANPVLTITQPTTFLAAPSCDARMIGGTAAFQNFITGTVTTTSVPLTYNGTPAASTTIILKVSCSN